jgi:hypothetical protein
MNLTRMHGRAAATIALSSCVTLVTAGAYARQGAGGKAEIRLKFHKGQVIKYKYDMTMAMAMTGMPGGQGARSAPPTTMSNITTQEVLNVRPDGSAEIRTTTILPKGPGGAPGQPPMGAPSGPVVGTSVMTPRGVVKDIKMEGQAGNSPALSGISKMFGGGQMSLHLPDHPVSPGYSWTTPLDMPGFSTGGKMKSTFVKFGSYHGQRTAVIHTVTSAPINLDLGMFGGRSGGGGQNLKGSIHMAMDSEISLGAGRIERTTGGGGANIHMPAQPGQPGAQQMPNGLTMTMKMSIDMHAIP